MKKLLLNNLVIIVLCCAFIACTKKSDTPAGVILPNITGYWKGDGWLNGTKFGMNLNLRKESDSLIIDLDLGVSGKFTHRGIWGVDEFTFKGSCPTTYAGQPDTLIIWAPISSKILCGNWYYKKNTTYGGIYDVKRPM